MVVGSTTLAGTGEESADEIAAAAATQDTSTSTSSSGPVPISRGGAIYKLPPLPAPPTMAQFRKFALPCLALWVAGPLLSLVDTSFVGLSGDSTKSAMQLAALGPATTFIDGSTYLFAFLNVATTNLYASARAASGDESSAKSEAVVRTASRVAVISGLGLMALLLTCSRPLLSLYIGAESTDLINAATEYVNIRALSMPTSLLLGVLQSALLGAKDSITPLVAILYSTVINVIGDYILVSRLGMGLKGASIATTLAQWAATISLIGPARRALLNGGGLQLLGSSRKVADGGTTNDVVTSKTFLKFAAPVLTLIIGKIAAFGFMTNAAAALPGQPMTLAAHQICLSLFFFMSPFLEVMSQTAQTFLPPYFAPLAEYRDTMAEQNQPEDTVVTKLWENEAYKLASRLIRIGFIVALFVASIGSSIPAFFSRILTTDAGVMATVKPLAIPLWFGAMLTAPVAISEGVLLARRELKFLAAVYMTSTAILPPALLRIKAAGGPVVNIWSCFAAFQLFRASCFAGKIWGRRFVNKILHVTGINNNNNNNNKGTTKQIDEKIA
eukprot:CAMPEP_0198285888 /NCGR_PEP_ID=MMETSP1449-20131203/5129_1 /TAXON_ID=420275 /ORGANISM="Attheya septentrionalis, Strain CCMP2084" /LENGTH=556 /DNA_ID=CAMNT_0043983501 /DNA_START=313 /DNA_END=1983 /DNA_ORIENTATION=+